MDKIESVLGEALDLTQLFSVLNDHEIHFAFIFSAVYLLCPINMVLLIHVDFEDLFDDDDIQ